MKKALMIAAAAATAGLAIWPAASASSNGNHREVRFVRMVVVSSYYVDNDPSGTSGGDLFGSTGDVRHDARRVGTYSSACTASSEVSGECRATIAWRDGSSLQLAGEFRLDQVKNQIAIIGGTGRFRRARGDAVLTQVDEDGAVQRAKLTIIRRS